MSDISDLLNKELSRLQPNSQEEKRQKHEIQKVDGIAKPNPVVQFARTLVTDDLSSIKTWAVAEAQKGIRDNIAGIANGAIDRLFRQGTPHSSTGLSSSLIRIPTVQEVSSIVRDYTKPQTIVQSQSKTAKFDLDNITMRDRASALRLIDALQENIKKYGNVSIAELLEAVGEETSDYTYNYYGWTDLSKASVKRNYYGYQIVFPEPVQLK